MSNDAQDRISHPRQAEDPRRAASNSIIANLLSLLLPLNMSPKRTPATKQRPLKRTRPCSFSLSVHLPLILIA